MKKEKESELSFTTVLLLLSAVGYRKLFWSLNDLSVYPPFSILFSRLPFHYSNKDYNIIFDLFYDLRFTGARYDYYILEIDHTFVYTAVIFAKVNNTKRKRFFTTLNKKVGGNNYYLVEVNEKTYKINFIRDKLSRKMLTIS